MFYLKFPYSRGKVTNLGKERQKICSASQSHKLNPKNKEDKTMKRIQLQALALVVCAALIVPAMAADKPDVKTFNGTIEGALCAIEGEVCPPDDLGVHLITEVNFVLRESNGKYYYLPNLSRSIKARYAGKDVQITGKAKGESIIADTFKAKEGGNYVLIWSLEKQKMEFMDYIQH